MHLPSYSPPPHPGESSGCGDRSSPGEGSHRAGSSHSGLLQLGLCCSQGFRLLEAVDLLCLNRLVVLSNFRMETPQSVLRSVRTGDWMISIDLQDAYLQVPVHQDSHRYLRFVEDGRSFHFRVLCFRLTTAPQVFTRVMAPISAILYCRGFRLLRYLDDWLILRSSLEEVISAKDFLLNLCSLIGI